MNSYFVYKMDINNNHRNVLVCYVASFGFDFNTFSDTIKHAFSDSPFSNDLVIISAEYNHNDIDSKLLKNERAIKKLKNSINNYQIMNIHSGLISKNGTPVFDVYLDPLEKSTFSLQDHFQEVIEAGFIVIIESRKLVMESSPNYHFIKPSGMHTSRFIKASNVLEVGSEISFIAINLIKYVREDIQKIYTDTAGIFPLAYELLNIYGRFNNKVCAGFVDSFGSYDGVDTYVFSGEKNTLVLISASTSDRLLHKLNKKVGLLQAKVVSLFSSNPHSQMSSTLVKFKHYFDKYNNPVFAHFKSLNGHECELCIYEKSVPLSLSNRQFVFEAPKTQLYLPLASDSDKKLKDLISNFKKSEVFKCLYDGLEGFTTPTPEYFIDVSKLVKSNKPFKDKTENVVKRHFPLSADLIVHANDQGAFDLAKYIKKTVLKLGKKVKIESILNIDKCDPKEGVVVVAGSIQSGKSLLDISRHLRAFNEYPITYIVGFAKYNDPVSFAKLKQDLVFNNGNPKLGKHHFITVEEIILPIGEHRINSWDRELEVLNLLKELPNNTEASKKTIEERIDYLRKATDKCNEGIGKQIFLESPTGKHMALGPTFAFWNEKDSKALYTHQATVYYTLSSILQSLRYSKIGRDSAPLGEGYVVKQLHPLLFDRFNEGIIQASVLRAAKPKELDYSDDAASSSIISSILLKMLNEPTDDTSEALPEFLLALCSGKLQIKNDFIRGILSITIDKEDFPFIWILLEYTKFHLLDYQIPPEVEGSLNIPF